VRALAPMQHPLLSCSISDLGSDFYPRPTRKYTYTPALNINCVIIVMLQMPPRFIHSCVPRHVGVFHRPSRCVDTVHTWLHSPHLFTHTCLPRLTPPCYTYRRFVALMPSWSTPLRASHNSSSRSSSARRVEPQTACAHCSTWREAPSTRWQCRPQR